MVGLVISLYLLLMFFVLVLPSLSEEVLLRLAIGLFFSVVVLTTLAIFVDLYDFFRSQRGGVRDGG